MSGKSLKIGIAAIAILLMTVAAVGAVSATTVSTNVPAFFAGVNTPINITLDNGTQVAPTIDVHITPNNAGWTVNVVGQPTATNGTVAVNGNWINITNVKVPKIYLNAVLNVSNPNGQYTPVTITAYFINGSTTVPKTATVYATYVYISSVPPELGTYPTHVTITARTYPAIYFVDEINMSISGKELSINGNYIPSGVYWVNTTGPTFLDSFNGYLGAVGPVTVYAKFYDKDTNTYTTATATIENTIVNLPPSNLDFLAYDTALGVKAYEVKLLTTPLSYTTSTVPNIIEYNYGTSFELGVTNYLSSTAGVTVKLKNLDSGNEITLGSIPKDTSYKAFTVSGLAPGKYAVIVAGSNGLPTWNLSAVQDPVIDNLVTNAPPQAILVYNKFPTISITLNNPRTPIALGDAAYFAVQITGLTGVQTAHFKLEGPFAEDLYFTAQYGGNNGTVHYVTIDTNNAANIKVDGKNVVVTDSAGNPVGFMAGKSGDWKLTVTCLDSKQTYTFKVEDVSVTANLPSSVVKGNSVTIQGTTNLAETGSVYDINGSNHVYVAIYMPNSTEIPVYKASLTENGVSAPNNVTLADNVNTKIANLLNDGKYVVEVKVVNATTKKIVFDKSVPYTDFLTVEPSDFGKNLTNLDITYYYYEGVPVKSDGTWKFTKTWDVKYNYPTGSYRIHVFAVASKAQTDDESYYITVNNPTLTINLANEYYRGEGLYIQGTSDLGAGAHIQITVQNAVFNNGEALLVTDVTSKQAAGTLSGTDQILNVYTSADGSWQSSKLYINPDAPRTTYTVIARLLDENGNPVDGVSAVGTINVVKPTLTAKLSMTNVVRGAKVTLSGTSPIDTLVLFTSDKGVFENVPKLPADSGKISEGMVIKTISGSDTFKVTLTVNKSARYDTYTLYVIASPDKTTYDLAKDPYVQLSVTVVPVGILYAPDTFTVTQGSAKKLFIEVNAKPDDVVFVGYSLKGHGVDITKDAMVKDGSGVTFGANNQFTKWNETANGTYWMFVTIYPYYESEASVKKLTPDYQKYEANGQWYYPKLLPVGLYELTIHVYTKDPDTHNFVESQTKTITMDVQPVKMTVTCPSEVVVGQPINVTIHENRVNCNQYDHIYVVMDLGTKLRKYMSVALNESGYATVSIPTGDVTPGTYKIYVRDTMGTFIPSGNITTITDFITNLYNLSPTSGYAKVIKADDDVLVVKTVKILASSEEITPTPTPTATATPTPTPTPTPKPTATPTPKPTATPTPTPTTTTTPTPTPTPKKKTPGFEAVFAIAGLIAVAYLLRRREL